MGGFVDTCAYTWEAFAICRDRLGKPSNLFKMWGQNRTLEWGWWRQEAREATTKVHCDSIEHLWITLHILCNETSQSPQVGKQHCCVYVHSNVANGDCITIALARSFDQHPWPHCRRTRWVQSLHTNTQRHKRVRLLASNLLWKSPFMPTGRWVLTHLFYVVASNAHKVVGLHLHEPFTCGTIVVLRIPHDSQNFGFKGWSCLM